MWFIVVNLDDFLIGREKFQDLEFALIIVGLQEVIKVRCEVIQRIIMIRFNRSLFERAIGALEQIIEWRGKPQALRCDNGPEYISERLQQWAKDKKLRCLISSPATHNRMRMSSGTTGQCVMSGWT